MLKKPAQTTRDLHPLIRDRWSPRAFDSSKPVPQDALISVLEAARWAASSNNVQPWRFIVATSADKEGHAKALSGFNERNQRWAKNAPVLIIALYRMVNDQGAPNGASAYDLGAAVAQAVQRAHVSIDAGIPRSSHVHHDVKLPLKQRSVVSLWMP